MAFAGRISIFGGREVTPDVLSMTLELGRELGKRHYLVFCGGGSGVMKAISQGVTAEGGTVVGILKGDSVSEANPWVTIPVLTNMGITRNALLAYNCDVAIAISGRYGTLSEIAYAMQLDKPVIGLQTWNIDGVHKAESVSDVINLLESLLPHGD